MTVRVVVADDEPIGRHRLVRLLQAEPETDVVASCADGEEAQNAKRVTTRRKVLLIPDPWALIPVCILKV